MILGIALFAVAGVQSAPPAQGTDSDASIVVTGERVRRTVRDTVSSVEVATSSRIERASADRVEQILELMPNVQVSSGGEGPTIRGQDTTGPSRDLYAFLGGTRPRTTLIVDGRAVSFNEFVFGISPLWDVDRVEVFRTPQTTTQGRNSIAGAIFVKTEDPTFAAEYRARGILGDFQTKQVSLTASGPIVPGQIAWRAAGDLRYNRTSSRLADRAAGADPNHDVYGLLRFKLLAQPAALPGTRILLNYSHIESQSPQVEGVRAPFRDRHDPLANYGTFRTNVDAMTANIAYERDALAVNAVLSGGNSNARRFAPPGLGEVRVRGRDWSGELVGNVTATPSLGIVGGVSHYGTRVRQYINLSQLAGEGRFRDDQGSTGLFGEANWTLAEGTILTAGLRYQHDRQDRVGELGTLPLDYHQDFQAWLPKASLAHDFTPSLRAGVLVQRAYNPGGTTLRFDTGAADNFRAETLWDYELFVRAGKSSDALTLTSNIFYYDQRDAQRSQPISIVAPSGAVVTFGNLFNVPKARSYGAEVGVDWRPSARFSARAGLGLLRTKIVDAGNEGAALEGKSFQRSPKLSASAAIDWRPLRQLLLSTQLRHNSSYSSDERGTAARRVDGSTRVDARAEWDAGKVRLFGYARNLFNKFYLTYYFLPTFATVGDPREVGIGIETRF